MVIFYRCYWRRALLGGKVARTELQHSSDSLRFPVPTKALPFLPWRLPLPRRL